MLGDGDHADALAPEHGLEGHGVLPLTGEAAEFPYQYDLERGRGLAALVDHVAELGPVGDTAALGLVHVLAGHGVAVVLGVVAQRPKLGGDGEVYVLSVAGDPGVEGCRGQGLKLLLHMCSFFVGRGIGWFKRRLNRRRGGPGGGSPGTGAPVARC